MKEMLISKRANLFYLEKCRVMVKDGVVVYLTEHKEEKQYWNIPITNTTVLLLKIGTSITQPAENGSRRVKKIVSLWLHLGTKNRRYLVPQHIH